MAPQLVAITAAISYAISSVAARRGMRYSNPITVTCFSLAVHGVGLWAVVFLAGGIPEVSPYAVLLFVIAGMLQPLIRLLTYTGIYRLGVSRSGPLRATQPLFSAAIAIAILGEKAGWAVISGTILIVIGVTLITRQPGQEPASFRWYHVLFPLGGALLAGIVHPIRRYALTLSNYPLFFTALMGSVSLVTLVVYLALPTSNERPVWDRRAVPGFLMAGCFETLGIVLVITALSLGPVVVVSPLISTHPLWILLGTVIFLRGIENVSLRTALGALLVVSGTVAISLWH